MHDVCHKFCCFTWVPRVAELNMRKDFVTDALKIIIWSLLQFPLSEMMTLPVSKECYYELHVKPEELLSMSLAHPPQPFPGSSLTTMHNHVPLDSSMAPDSWWRLWFYGSCAVKFCIKWRSWMNHGQEGVIKMKTTCIALLSFLLQWDFKVLNHVFRLKTAKTTLNTKKCLNNRCSVARNMTWSWC